MPRRKGSHTDRRGSDKLDPDWIERGIDTRSPGHIRKFKGEKPVGSGNAAASELETLLFFLAETVNAMRAAYGRKDSGPPRTKGDSPMLSSQGSWSQDMEQITGLGMPEPCWNAFQRHIRKIAIHCGLSVKIKERYIDPLSVVYVEFFRKGK